MGSLVDLNRALSGTEQDHCMMWTKLLYLAVFVAFVNCQVGGDNRPTPGDNNRPTPGGRNPTPGDANRRTSDYGGHTGDHGHGGYWSTTPGYWSCTMELDKCEGRFSGRQDVRSLRMYGGCLKAIDVELCDYGEKYRIKLTMDYIKSAIDMADGPISAGPPNVSISVCAMVLSLVAFFFTL